MKYEKPKVACSTTAIDAIQSCAKGIHQLDSVNGCASPANRPTNNAYEADE